ncbi:MAG: DUF2797 domain-containing protein [Candidatus Thorarchaeota archaeon]
MHVLEVHWRLRNSQTFECGLLFWTEKADEPHFVPFDAKKTISWTIRGPRRCVGSIDSEGRRRKCPEIAVVGPGRRRCGLCSAMDIMDPCIRCDGRDCNASEERSESCSNAEYAVYLAVFNDSTLKVGVSKEARLLTRWVEQGADFGGVIARVKGGRRARQIEYDLSQGPNVTRQVSGERKASLLLQSLDHEKAQSIAQTYLGSIDAPEVERTTELMNLACYYGLNELHAEPHRWHPKGAELDGLQILGEVVGMKGPLLVTRINESFSVVNLGNLVGYAIDEDAEISIVSQTGIMDFS